MNGVGGIAGLVLAGGLSRRMGGRDKSLSPLAGVPMIARVIERLAPQVGRLAISANADPAAFAGFGLPVLPDLTPGNTGPLAGVAAGMAWAARDPAITHLVSVATDAPFLPRDLVARFVERASPGRIVLARSASGRHPVFGLWPLALSDDLDHWLATSPTMRVFTWVEPHDPVWCDFAPEGPGAPDPFFNANTPDDLAAAAAHLHDGS
ncbi:molybdenum cofactor guanylyltransferase MobA [Pinisolibacter sp.]|uniref:molybdenum cofactor guanylyltransferase MobA n=1 Tax=Pinisolibacter sp. TaxID=2172024 RepID=UPI002FDE8AA9